MKKSQKKLLCSLIGSALLVSASGIASAEESFNLDEYVVTASRIPVKLTETAANVTVISQDEIEKGNFTTVPEILRKSNISLEEDSNGVLPLLNGDPRVLVLVDGLRMNWDQVVKSGSKGGVNLSRIPVQNIERIEIVRGPASSLYGSDAVGGVINIITRKAARESTSFASEAGSWGMRRYSLTTENKLENGFGYMITAEHKKQDDFEYKDAVTGQIKRYDQSYYDEDSLTMRLDKELENGHSLSLQVDHDDRSGGFTWTKPGHSYLDGYYFANGYSKSQDNNVALTYRSNNNNFFRMYQNHSSEDITGTVTSDYSITRNARGAEWQRSLQLNDAHTLVGGADWRQFEFNYPSQGINNTYNTKAIFLEDHWQLPSNWTLTLGSRYDDHSIIGDHITSRLTANRKLNDTTNVFASWGQFVKAPLVEDLFSNTKYMEGNPNLRPETGDTITVGVNTQLSNGTKLQASAFSSNVNDAIDYHWGNGTTIKTKAYNIDDQKRHGLDLNLTHQFSPQWSASAGYSFIKVENKDEGQTGYADDLTNSQPNGYRLNVQYNQDKWDAGLTLRSATGRSLEQFTSRSFVTLDMVANYQLQPDTRIYFKGYNLTNRAYEVRGVGDWMTPGAYPMAARSFYLGVEHKL